jgi:hypothetical protein
MTRCCTSRQPAACAGKRQYYPLQNVRRNVTYSCSLCSFRTAARSRSGSENWQFQTGSAFFGHMPKGATTASHATSAAQKLAPVVLIPINFCGPSNSSGFRHRRSEPCWCTKRNTFFNMADPSPCRGRMMKVVNGSEAIGRFHVANANTMLVTFFRGAKVQALRVLGSPARKLHSAYSPCCVPLDRTFLLSNPLCDPHSERARVQVRALLVLCVDLLHLFSRVTVFLVLQCASRKGKPVDHHQIHTRSPRWNSTVRI